MFLGEFVRWCMASRTTLLFYKELSVSLAAVLVLKFLLNISSISIRKRYQSVANLVTLFYKAISFICLPLVSSACLFILSKLFPKFLKIAKFLIFKPKTEGLNHFRAGYATARSAARQ